MYEKRVTCVSDFNLQNGSSTLNTGGRPPALVGSGAAGGASSFSLEKLDLAALTAQRLGLPLRLPKVRLMAVDVVVVHGCLVSLACLPCIRRVWGPIGGHKLDLGLNFAHMVTE